MGDLVLFGSGNEHLAVPVASVEPIHPSGLVAKITDTAAPRWYSAVGHCDTRVSPVFIGRYGLVAYVDSNGEDSDGRIHLDRNLLVPELLWNTLGSQAGFRELFMARRIADDINLTSREPSNVKIGQSNMTYLGWTYCDVALKQSFYEDCQRAFDRQVERLSTFERELDPFLKDDRKTQLSLN